MEFILKLLNFVYFFVLILSLLVLSFNALKYYFMCDGGKPENREQTSNEIRSSIMMFVFSSLILISTTQLKFDFMNF